MPIVNKSNRKLQIISITVLSPLFWVLVYPAAFANNSIEPESLNLDAINISQQNVLKQFSSYAQNQGTLDQNGWSVLTPSEDSRLIYVSASSGNDKNGKIYNRDQITNINSPGEISEFKSIQAALKHFRTGYADYLLLKRGDTWLSKGIVLSGGRSAAERMVLMSYGEFEERPIIKSTGPAIKIFGSASSIAIVGINLYASNRDPESEDFSGWGANHKGSGILAYAKADKIAKGILIEDCIINFFQSGIVLTGDAKFEDIEIRRNFILNSYSEISHSQGLYAVNSSMLLEGNLFDHNGWRQSGDGTVKTKKFGQATKFNHNTYFTNSSNVVMRNNLFLRASSAHNKLATKTKMDINTIKSENFIVRDNFYYGGEIGIGAWGNVDKKNGPRWQNLSIVDNVMIGIGKNQPTNRTLGWYMVFDDWKTGVVCGNYLIDNQNLNVSNLVGISIAGHSSDIIVSHNTISGLLTDSPKKAAISLSGDSIKNFTIAFNSIQLSNSRMRILAVGKNLNNRFLSNSYFTGADSDEWFQLGKDKLGYENWKKVTLDQNANIVRKDYGKSTRDFESYLTSIGNSSIDKFVISALRSTRSKWPDTYSAKAINQYLRQAYDNQTCPSIN